MTFLKIIHKVAIKDYRVFAGRASRAEFWWFLPFFIGGVFSFLIIAIGISGSEFVVMIYVLLPIFLRFILIPFIAVMVRRLHDMNRIGWWSLVYLLSSIMMRSDNSVITPLGLIIWVAFMASLALKGSKGKNFYGDNPIESENTSE